MPSSMSKVIEAFDSVFAQISYVPFFFIFTSADELFFALKTFSLLTFTVYEIKAPAPVGR